MIPFSLYLVLIAPIFLFSPFPPLSRPPLFSSLLFSFFWGLTLFILVLHTCWRKFGLRSEMSFSCVPPRGFYSKLSVLSPILCYFNLICEVFLFPTLFLYQGESDSGKKGTTAGGSICFLLIVGRFFFFFSPILYQPVFSSCHLDLRPVPAASSLHHQV